MRIGIRRTLAAALLSAGIFLTLSSCGAQRTAQVSNAAPVAVASVPEATEAPRGAGIAVETRTVRMETISSDSTVSGSVTADDTSSIMVGVTGKVLETFVAVGDTVEEGQPLCRLDVDSTLSSYRAARLNLASAQQSYNDQTAVFTQQIAALNEQIAVAERQVPLAQQQIPIVEQTVPQAEAQIGLVEQQKAQLEEQLLQVDTQLSVLEQQIELLEDQAALAEKQVHDLEALLAIGAASQAEIDNAVMQLGQVKLQISQANLQVDQAKMQRDQADMQRDQLEVQLLQANMQVDQARLQLAQTELQPAQAQLQVSQARLQLASATAQRNSTLGQLQASIESARSSVQQLETALRNIDENGNVTATAAGVVTTFNAQKDSYVSSAMPVAVISGAEKLDITVAVSESLIPKLHAGDRADVSVPALGLRFTAEIRTLDQSANVATRLYNVKLAVPGETSDLLSGLLPGMFADVTFHTDTVENAVVIPSEAILTSGDRQFVYVVDENDIAHYTEVTTGMTGAGVTVVTDGLREGQRLVTVGQTYLSEGDSVRVIREDAAQ